MPRRPNEDAHFRMMRLIEARPEISQRELSRELGLSLGAVNYCLSALIEKGHVKMLNFRASDHKLGYAYLSDACGHCPKGPHDAGFSGAQRSSNMKR